MHTRNLTVGACMSPPSLLLSLNDQPRKRHPVPLLVHHQLIGFADSEIQVIVVAPCDVASRGVLCTPLWKLSLLEDSLFSLEIIHWNHMFLPKKTFHTFLKSSLHNMSLDRCVWKLQLDWLAEAHNYKEVILVKDAKIQHYLSESIRSPFSKLNMSTLRLSKLLVLFTFHSNGGWLKKKKRYIK